MTVGPGQLNSHFRLASSSATYLIKVSRADGEDALAGESAALAALAVTAALAPPHDRIHISQTLRHGPVFVTRAYAVLPFVPMAPFGSSIPGIQALLGRGLARIHASSALAAVHAGRFGFERDTFLGAARQDNAWSAPGDWVGFFVRRRLAPRLREAQERFGGEWGTNNASAVALSRALEVCSVAAVGTLFENVAVVPSLLHGDLFMGNCGAVRDGGERRATMYDPASSFGHSEMDLALSTMWGRFLPVFHEEYHAIIPKEDGFGERQELYRFYYLLTMLVLHGPGFGSKGTSGNSDGYMERCIDCLAKLEKIFASKR